MKPASFKAKIQRILINEGFKKSETSKGRIIPNVSSGFTIEKFLDEYYLHYTCGNLSSRGMAVEDQDVKTIEMYEKLIELGFESNLKLDSIRTQKAVILKPEVD